MNLGFAMLSMAFLLSVGALAIGSAAFVAAIFFGYPMGWSVALAITSLAFASSGWRGLTNIGIGVRGISNNAEGAFGLVHIFSLVSIASFAFSTAPYHISSWWALLFPFLIIPFLFFQWLFELVLDLINPSGKRL